MPFVHLTQTQIDTILFALQLQQAYTSFLRVTTTKMCMAIGHGWAFPFPFIAIPFYLNASHVILFICCFLLTHAGSSLYTVAITCNIPNVDMSYQSTSKGCNIKFTSCDCNCFNNAFLKQPFCIYQEVTAFQGTTFWWGTCSTIRGHFFSICSRAFTTPGINPFQIAFDAWVKLCCSSPNK